MSGVVAVYDHCHTRHSMDFATREEALYFLREGMFAGECSPVEVRCVGYVLQGAILLRAVERLPYPEGESE